MFQSVQAPFAEVRQSTSFVCLEPSIHLVTTLAPKTTTRTFHGQLDHVGNKTHKKIILNIIHSNKPEKRDRSIVNVLKLPPFWLQVKKND